MVFVVVRLLCVLLCVVQYFGLGFWWMQQVRGCVVVLVLWFRLLSVRCNVSEGESERFEVEDVKKDLKIDFVDEEFGGWFVVEFEDEF